MASDSATTGRPSLLRASLLVVFFFALSKLTGFAKLLVMTRVFGAGPAADAFTAANQLPDVFKVMVGNGALAAAFIPVYTRYRDSAEARTRLPSTIVTLVLLGMGVICLAAALAAPWLTRQVLVPDFSAEQQRLTADLMRIVLLGIVILAVSAVVASILNAHQHFAMPAFATVAIDIGYLIGLVAFVPLWGIFGVAWGGVLGALLHLGVQIPALMRHGVTLRPTLALRLAGVSAVLRLMGPRVGTLTSVQLADLIVIRLASRLPDGSVSAYFYAYLLMQLPTSLFSSAIGLVFFPTLAERFNAGDEDGARRAAAQALRAIWVLAIPGGIGLIALGQPAVAFVLQRGAFDEQATALVTTILVIFSLRIVAEASMEIIERLFYARHNTLTPMLGYWSWLAVYGVGSTAAIDRWGILGVAAASTLATVLLPCGLYLRYRRVAAPLPERELAWTIGRILLACVGMVLVIGAVHRLELALIPFLALAVGSGGVTFVLLYSALGGREPLQLWEQLRSELAQVRRR